MHENIKSREEKEPEPTLRLASTAKIKQSNGTDLLTAIVLVFTLMAVIYFTPTGTYNFFSLSLMIIILIPTIIALVSGAPFVPTPMQAVKKMLALADIKKGDKVYDIGCGDGRMVYLAAKDYGANATGFELSPLVYALAKIRQFFWRSKAKITFGDFRFYNLKEADVVVCYLLPETLAKLQTKLDKELKKGAKVISYAFQIGDWKEHHREERNRENNIAPIWVYQK